ncbi:MAG: S8 family serine peptidase [Microthrixaceae bacterium]
MVVAAGNDGAATILDTDDQEVPNPSHNIWNVPGAAEWSMTVGSMTPDRTMSEFSTQASYVDVTGPRSGVLSTAFDQDGATWEQMSGTSDGDSHVAGLAAVLRGAFPGDSAAQIVERVTASAASFGTGDVQDASDGCPVGTRSRGASAPA